MDGIEFPTASGGEHRTMELSVIAPPGEVKRAMRI